MPPMQVSQRGATYEVALALPRDDARRVLAASGKTDGVEARLFAVKGKEPPPSLRGSMTWLQLPEGAPPSTATHWAVLNAAKELPFAGIVRGDSPGRLGVRLWGLDPTAEHRAQVAALLGAMLPPKKMRLRARGYPATFGSQTGYAQTALAAALETSGQAGAVTVTAVRHLAYSGVDRPVYDVEATGVPADWTGAVIPPPDARQRSRSWEVLTLDKAAPKRTAIGRRSRLLSVATVAEAPASAAAGGQDASAVDDDEEIDEAMEVAGATVV